ncbi:unnamed protein product [Rotaria sp. Silwood1]|nr:unnamed protein product [Rotaria sp. Silwood1]CAF1155381.1 unnamed protein product [Rotaria sp. Silwood1]CAF3438736.1 unnamed protein product [Rotaria sp. Silwood1]CAF3460306.1 unnamed protein product [Rotaria sp. Silwood1]CAF4589579.1 unnamed protein product [Rotaria sp. Silwood1]
MSNSEFKARALYDFAAEGPNELSFNANDILTITSNRAGHGWWFAKNSSGQVGVIPENYVQALADPPEPNEPPPPLSTFSNTNNTYLNKDIFNSNNNLSKTSSIPSSHPPSYDPPQYMNPTSYNNWQPIDSSTWQSSSPSPVQPLQVNEEHITNSIQSLKFPTETEEKFVNAKLITTNSYDEYIKVIDVINVSSEFNFLPITNSNSNSLLRNSWNEQLDDFYDYLPNTPAPPLINTKQLSPFFFPNFLISTQQQTTKSNQYLIPVSSSPTESIYGSIDDIQLSLATRTSTRRDTDSDDSFSDSEYPPQSSQTMNSTTLTPNSTFSNTTRTSMASGEANRTTPRARFFDKHGLDNYLLNGSKAKSDEHVEISFDETEGGVHWSHNPGLPPFSCKVEDPSKGTKLGGLKAFTEYKIHPQIPGSRYVCRRYKQFDWLHEQLVNKFRFVCIPPLPGKQIAGRFEQEFVEERRRQLELWLNRVCRHPVLCATYAVQHFITCETNDKNRKDWKGGKRRVEKDDLREASWLSCVTLTNTGLSESEIASQIETFAQQQPGLEIQLKNLYQGLSKYLERYTEVYERDIQRISELFSRVHQAVVVDTTTPGNKDLSNSISKISGSYSGVADLYKTKASEGLRDFIERIQEYIGILACFPSILNIQRSATDFIKTASQRAPPDFSNAIHRGHVLNHVVLAEINFFQKEKVADLKVYMKTLVDEQIQFYEKISAALLDASITFK